MVAADLNDDDDVDDDSDDNGEADDDDDDYIFFYLFSRSCHLLSEAVSRGSEEPKTA